MGGERALYVVKSPWYFKILGAVTLCAVGAGLWHAAGLVELWTEGGAFRRLSIIVVVPLMLLGVLEIFLKRTVFSADGIEHRTRYGTRLSRPYSDIEGVIRSSDTLEIVFRDHRRVTIHAADADFPAVLEILKRHRGVPVTSE